MKAPSLFTIYQEADQRARSSIAAQEVGPCRQRAKPRFTRSTSSPPQYVNVIKTDLSRRFSRRFKLYRCRDCGHRCSTTSSILGEAFPPTQDLPFSAKFCPRLGPMV